MWSRFRDSRHAGRGCTPATAPAADGCSVRQSSSGRPGLRSRPAVSGPGNAVCRGMDRTGGISALLWRRRGDPVELPRFAQKSFESGSGAKMARDLPVLLAPHCRRVFTPELAAACEDSRHRMSQLTPASQDDSCSHSGSGRENRWKRDSFKNWSQWNALCSGQRAECSRVQLDRRAIAKGLVDRSGWGVSPSCHERVRKRDAVSVPEPRARRREETR
jgi:hypothetical protein